MSIRLSDRTLAEIRRQNKIGRVMPSDVVELLIQQIEQLRAAQCWVIVNKETGATFLGPFFTEAHANDKLGSMPFEYAKNYGVQSWKGGAE